MKKSKKKIISSPNPWLNFLWQRKNRIKVPLHDLQKIMLWVLTNVDPQYFEKSRMIRSVERHGESLVLLSIPNAKIIGAYKKAIKRGKFSLKDLTWIEKISTVEVAEELHRLLFLAFLENLSVGGVNHLSQIFSEKEVDIVRGFLKKRPLTKNFDFYQDGFALCRRFGIVEYQPFYYIMLQLKTILKRGEVFSGLSENYKKEAKRIVNAMIREEHFSLAKQLLQMLSASGQYFSELLIWLDEVMKLRAKYLIPVRYGSKK